MIDMMDAKICTCRDELAGKGNEAGLYMKCVMRGKSRGATAKKCWVPPSRPRTATTSPFLYPEIMAECFKAGIGVT